MAAFKKKIGDEWVSIAGSSSGVGKAINVDVEDANEYFESDNVEGVLAEIADQVKRADDKFKAHVEKFNDHLMNHPGGSGGGSGGGSVTMPTITSDFEISTSDGESVIEIPIFFTSPSLGEGTCYILVNNIERGTQTVNQGSNTILIPPIGAGKNILIAIYVKDRAGLLSNQLTWTVTAGGIKMNVLTDFTSSFNVGGRIAMAYNISCVSTEAINVHLSMKKDGETEPNEIIIPSKNGYNSYLFKNLTVGVYRCTYYAESGDYVTPEGEFTLVIVDSETVLVVADIENNAEFESGIPITIPYRIAIDLNEDFAVKMYINGELSRSIVTRPSYLYWSITSLNPGDYALKITATNEKLGLNGECTFNIKVIEGEYTRIQPVDDASLLCWFDASEKTNNDADRDEWVDKIWGTKAKLYNFNYGSNGWIRPEGSSISELKMDGTCYVEIDMAPFADNFKNGGTIELVFKTRDVGNDAARVLDITDVLSPFKGVYIDTREAYLSTDAKTINASIGADEYIHVMYIIDRVNKFAHVVVNGVITKSCQLTDSGTGTGAILEGVAHDQKVYLNSKKGTGFFGSCEVKHFRVYDRALAFDEILQNYLSTIDDIALQKTKSDFNNPLKNIMPIMNITVDPEMFAKMTDTNMIEVAMTYTSPNADLYGQTLTTATNCLMYWQGTSSKAYAVKNYNLRLRDKDRREIMYSPYPNCIPQSLFCLKANLMESTNAHNVGLADFVRRYLYDSKNPAEQADSRTSRTIQGFPILLYINGVSQGVYDFNLDRYSTTAFGYDLPVHAKKCRVYEISANTDVTAGAFIPWENSDRSTDEWSWYKNDFKGIYPEEIQNPINDDYAALKELIKFVANSTNEVFITEFDAHFDKESVLRYYIMVMVLGLVDSLGKNAKLVTYDGVKWYFEFYDMDTALGLDNTGATKYDVDMEVESGEFNTSESTLWKRIRELFAADINAEYEKMRNGGNLTPEKIFECMFTNQIEKIPESEYNNSTQAKYLNYPEFIMMGNGNRYYGLKRWIRERFLYCDTLFKYSPTTAKYITVRAGLVGKVYMDIQTYSPMYVTVRWRNQIDGSADTTIKVGRNETVRFEGQTMAKDQEIIIYGAEHLKDLGQLDGMMPTHLLLSEAKKLTRVECPKDDNLINIQITGCTYLQRLNLEGCSSLGKIADSRELNVDTCNNLRYLNAYGTVLTSINTNQSGGNLVEMYVPKTLQKLELRNQYSLKIVGIPGANTLEQTKMSGLLSNSSAIASFTMINCPLVERLTYSKNFTAGSTFFDNYGNERRGSELDYLNYPEGEWKRLMCWGNGLANCNSIHIENSCHNVPGMSFRCISNLTNLTLRNMPHLKTLLLGANCCGYRYNNEPTLEAEKYDIVSEFDWSYLNLVDTENIEEFRIHEMYPYNYNEGQTGNLTYFAFKPGTNVLNLPEKFPNLKVFECNCATQNIHQIILPQSLKSIITYAWNNRHDEGFLHEVKIDQFNIDSIFFEGEHDGSYIGVDLGNHELEDVRIVAPFATSIEGVNIKNRFVNPIFNDLKEENNESRPYVTPNGVINVSEFQWRNISDWFAFIDFTKAECEVIAPTDWDTFLSKIEKASRMFFHCINPDFTWDFAMKFFSKLNTHSDLGQMYKFAKLKEQVSFEADAIDMINDKNIGGYNFNAKPFQGTNLKFVRSFQLSGCDGAYGTFLDCDSLIKIGDCSFTGDKSSGWGVDYLFGRCKSLQEVGSITSNATMITFDNTFEDCSNLIKIGPINAVAESMNSTYLNCSILPTEGLSLPDMSEVLDIRSAFRGCAGLTGINLTTLAKVQYADNSFRGCTGLLTLHLPTVGRDSTIQDLSYAFYGCKSLTTITIEGATLPINLRAMNYTYGNCDALQSVPPIPTDFTYDVDLGGCFSRCSSITDDAIYKDIPARIVNTNYMYEYCNGLIDPVVNFTCDNVTARQMFRYCSGLNSLTVNFNGRLLKESMYFAEFCNNLRTVNFKFPNALVMHEYYGTGVTYYNMFQNCMNLSIVNLDMSRLANTNSKLDLGGMLFDNKYVTEINGLDLTCLKKPIRPLTSSGQNPYDWHDDSVTYGGTYENLTTFGLVGKLNTSYNFKNIASLAHTKTILRNLDTVTSEVLGLTYNVMDAIDDEKNDYVDPELKTLATEAIAKGWTFAIV